MLGPWLVRVRKARRGKNLDHGIFNHGGTGGDHSTHGDRGFGRAGAKRRRELLRYFGGIQGIARASLEELMKVPGINRPLAERIFAAFHDATL